MAYMTNGGELPVVFGTLGGNANVVVSHGAFFIGTQLVWTGSLAVERTFTPGDSIELPIGAFDINLPQGDLTDAAVQAAWTALYTGASSAATMHLGTAAMGSAGDQNRVAASGYSAQSVTLTIALGTAPTT